MSNNRSNYPGPIPSRWLKCPRKADSLVASKFLAFKTPLSSRYDSQVPDECIFYPSMLFQLMKDVYKVKIGLWIDLTFTSRFYDRTEVEKSQCQYVKLQCRGYGETPSWDQTKSFIELVDDFSSQHPFEIIAVHCTHGFNRTGFLIVSYLVEKQDFSVEAALQIFAQARPPGIYKEEYIRELFKRYEDEADADTVPPVVLPDWCYDEEETPDEYSSTSNSYNNLPSTHPMNHHSSRKRTASNDQSESSKVDSFVLETEAGESGEPAKKKKKPEFLNLNATFMAGVSGVSLVTDKRKANSLQQEMQEMCEWSKGGFPGSQPVSMDRNNINLLHTKPYQVSWKADGTRYMMYIKCENEIYFFDRDNACFEVKGLFFPQRKDLTKHVANTLVDGEMVLDKVNGQTIPRYLVYDIVKHENEDLGKQAFYPNRLNCIKNYIIDPRNEAIKRGLIRKEREPFSVRNKGFWPVIQAKALLAPKFAASLSHEPDGLIFQPALEPYVPGRCDEVLKWKPANLNSVDFKLKISEESGVGILSKKVGLLYVGGMSTPFAQIKYVKQLKELDNKIIECKFENNSWVFMRERTDKSYPNSYNTAKAVCQSIQFPVTKEGLLEYIEKYRFVDDTS